MKSFKGQQDIQSINVESNDYDYQTQHFDANGEEVTEIDSGRRNDENYAVYVSQLAVKSLDKKPMKKAKSMFQVFLGEIVNLLEAFFSEFRHVCLACIGYGDFLFYSCTPVGPELSKRI